MEIRPIFHHLDLKFWQSIKFMNKGHFPKSCWALGRFLGIAWDTGDLLTFKVWSKLDGNWKNRSEFTKNVVQPRNEDEIPIDSIPFSDNVMSK